MQDLIKKAICSASTWLWDRSVQRWRSSSKFCAKTSVCSSQQWWLLPPLMQLPFSFLHHIPAVPWQSTSETTECMPSFSTTISPNKRWLTDRCRCCCVGRLDVRHTPETCSISTHACWSVLQK